MIGSADATVTGEEGTMEGSGQVAKVDRQSSRGRQDGPIRPGRFCQPPTFHSTRPVESTTQTKTPGHTFATLFIVVYFSLLAALKTS